MSYDMFGHDGFDDDGWGDGINRNPRYRPGGEMTSGGVVISLVLGICLFLLLLRGCP